MSYIHKKLAAGRWFELSLFEQMANIGSEVERAISWRKKKDFDYSRRAFERALELLGLTISDPRYQKRLKELTRLYEVLGDYFVGENEYKTTDQSLQKYFYSFTYAANLKYRYIDISKC